MSVSALAGDDPVLRVDEASLAELRRTVADWHASGIRQSGDASLILEGTVSHSCCETVLAFRGEEHHGLRA